MNNTMGWKRLCRRLLLSLALLASPMPAVWSQPAAESEAEQEQEAATIDITTNEGDAEGEPLRISMNLQDAELKDVLKVFSEQSGLNIIAAKDVENLRVTLFLKEVDVQDALSQILRVNDLVAERLPESDIYVVKSAAPSAATAPVEPGAPSAPETVTRIYKLKYAHVSTSILQGAVDSLVRGQSPFEASRVRLVASGASGGASGGSSGGSTTSGESGIDKVIERLLTDVGKLVADDRTNSLIVTDIPTNFPRIEAAIQQLDVPTRQVLIEAELIETTVTKAKHLGIEYGTGSEGSLLTVTPPVKNTLFPFQAEDGLFAGPNDTSGLPFLTRGTTVGTINAAQFVMVLKALEQDSDTRILARPRVMTLDNQSAVIRLTEDTAISVNTTTSGTGSDLTQTTTVERSPTGVVLSVTPQINSDGTVTMLIEPSVNKPVTSSLTSSSQPVLNPKERSARALIRLNEGATFVLGGLIDRQEKRTVRKVPLLGDIPLIGGAFRKLTVDNSDTELLVFITPHIVREERLVADVSAADFLRAREQEGISSREAIIEESLNVWEQRRRHQQ